jgi:hypothetical protein
VTPRIATVVAQFIAGAHDWDVQVRTEFLHTFVGLSPSPASGCGQKARPSERNNRAVLLRNQSVLTRSDVDHMKLLAAFGLVVES